MKKIYIILPQDLLKNMIKQTVFAISQDQTKPVLMGELIRDSRWRYKFSCY